jgi:hypothetical protein
MAIHQEASVRYTFNMPTEMHKYLRYAAIDESTHVNILVLNALTNWIENREEAIDERNYLNGKKDLEAGDVVDFDSAMQELGL